MKQDILKNIDNQTVLVTIDFHCMDKNTDVSQNIMFSQVWNNIKVSK